MAGEFGFGGDELAFAGGFEDGGAVAFEVGLHAPQRRYPRLQSCELLLNLGDDAALLGEGWNRQECIANNSLTDVRLGSAFALLDQLASLALEETIEVASIKPFGRKYCANRLVRRRINSKDAKLSDRRTVKRDAEGAFWKNLSVG